MAEFILKDWYGKDQVFDKETIYVQGTDGELMPFTHGTGSSAELRYVTFMSYDGLIEYGKKAVAVGDDCADPIARGVFATPTRESDVQYNYIFYGWATEPNGGADANWNKSITEDKTVYANFSKAVRYYTITYYDSDGTTVLKTESLAYGAMPSYRPEKDGYSFAGWNIELATVTGNASYIATWEEKITFAGASWAKIAEISEAGEASKYFAVGDTRKIAYNGTTITVAIAGFDHDDLANGTGKAGMSIVCMTVPNTKTQWASFSNSSWNYYYSDATYNQIKNAMDTCKIRLPSELKAVIKSVNKECDSNYNSSTTDKINYACDVWLLSLTELGFTTTATQIVPLGARYDLFPEKTTTAASGTNLPTVTITDTTTKAEYWARQLTRNGQVCPCYVKTNGSSTYHNLSSSVSDEHYIRFGFCI